MMSKILSLSLITAMSLLLVTSTMNNAYATVTITPTIDAPTLSNAILGAGLTPNGAPTFLGAVGQAGTFTNGISSQLGIESGIVLHTGNVAQIPGPNGNAGAGFPETLGGMGAGDDDINVNTPAAGDAQLSVIAGVATFDASVLTIPYTAPAGGPHNIGVQFVFASEEYVDWVGTQFNDVFGFFHDGVNIALLPDGVTPITINSINPNTNPAFYINNVANTNGFPVAGADHAFDGYTTVLMVEVQGVTTGNHVMKFAIADSSDSFLDAAVFIEAFGLMCPEGTTGIIPNCKGPVGGEFLPIDTSALLLAGAQTNAVWIMSALAVIGSIAFGALYITSKKN